METKRVLAGDEEVTVTGQTGGWKLRLSCGVTLRRILLPSFSGQALREFPEDGGVTFLRNVTSEKT
jgi:hypothetical protein